MTTYLRPHFQEPMEIEEYRAKPKNLEAPLTSLLTTTDAFYPIIKQLFKCFEKTTTMVVSSSSSLMSSTENKEEEECRQVIKTLVNLSSTNKKLYQYIQSDDYIWMLLYKRVPWTTDVLITNNIYGKLRKMVYMKYIVGHLLNLRGVLVDYCNVPQNLPLMGDNNGLIQVSHSPCVMVVKENNNIRRATNADSLGAVRMMSKKHYDCGVHLQNAINGFLQNLRVPRCL